MALLSTYSFADAHPHQGVLTPYSGPPQSVVLSTKDQQKLAQFKPVYKKWSVNNKQRAVAVFRVKAPANIVWSVIHQFSAYPRWIKAVKSTEVYERSGNIVYVQFTAKHWLLGKTTWYVKHDFPSLDKVGERHWGTWTLDYRHRSDFDDSVGFWQVLPVKDNTRWSDVTYSVDLKLRRNTPQFIRNSAIKKGLKTATKWVKKHSENTVKN